jgi:antitoxin component YwqK of YwqJK toxin-antitoxin module
MNSEIKCVSITIADTRCARNATIDDYSKQHYNLSEEKNKLEQELPPEITKFILSDYIEYDELKQLKNEFSGLIINPNRIKIEEQFYYNGKIRNRKTYKDEILTKDESYHINGIKVSEHNYKNGELEGPQYYWYENGNKRSEKNYINGKLEGKIFIWFQNRNKEIEENYVNGKKEGKQYYWYINGQIENEENYINGKKRNIK